MTPADSWGVIGGFNSWAGDVAMTESETGVWTVTMNELEGEFKFRMNASWDVNYGASEVADITGNGEYGIAASGNNFNIVKVENVTLTLDLNKGILTVATESFSGVSAIEGNEGHAKYFNLQGAEVANPQNGLYIKIVGEKVSKVLVK